MHSRTRQRLMAALAGSTLVIGLVVLAFVYVQSFADIRPMAKVKSGEVAIVKQASDIIEVSGDRGGSTWILPSTEVEVIERSSGRDGHRLVKPNRGRPMICVNDVLTTQMWMQKKKQVPPGAIRVRVLPQQDISCSALWPAGDPHPPS